MPTAPRPEHRNLITRRDGSASRAVRALARALAVLLLHAGGVLWAAPDGGLLAAPDWGRLDPAPQGPAISARSALLVEMETGAVLFAKNPHLVLPAASLTKVVAIHAAVVAARTGELDLAAIVEPPAPSWAENQPPGSSLMFLGAGQELSVWQLLEGLAVSSGNDAAVALAIHADGSVPAFARRMNRSVRAAGLRTSSFVEPSGIDPRNLITAYEYAAFLREHLQSFPELLAGLYSRRSYTYPLLENRGSGSPVPSITQSNRNLLLERYDGADGVKTGFIDESGYHLAATAERDGRRLIAVVLGVDASSHADGGERRAADAAALLDFGFSQFTVLRFTHPPVSEVVVWKGVMRKVAPRVPAGIVVSIPRGAEQLLAAGTEQLTELVAPVPEGGVVGTTTVRVGELVLAQAQITAPAVQEGGFFRRAWDGLVLFFRSLFGGQRPPEGSALTRSP